MDAMNGAPFESKETIWYIDNGDIQTFFSEFDKRLFNINVWNVFGFWE
jgi:hypothetical protein